MVDEKMNEIVTLKWLKGRFSKRALESLRSCGLRSFGNDTHKNALYVWSNVLGAARKVSHQKYVESISRRGNGNNA